MTLARRALQGPRAGFRDHLAWPGAGLSATLASSNRAEEGARRQHGAGASRSFAGTRIEASHAHRPPAAPVAHPLTRSRAFPSLPSRPGSCSLVPSHSSSISRTSRIASSPAPKAHAPGVPPSRRILPCPRRSLPIGTRTGSRSARARSARLRTSSWTPPSPSTRLSPRSLQAGTTRASRAASTRWCSRCRPWADARARTARVPPLERLASAVVSRLRG